MAPLTRDKTFPERQRELQLKAREENGGQKTGTTTIPKRLYDNSAAYRAYIRIQRLPNGTPNFDYSHSGYPLVHVGEYICRMPGLEPQKHCGHKALDKSHLHQHLERVHKMNVNDRPCSRAGGYAGPRDLAHAFYLKIMRSEDYEGKHSTNGLLGPVLDSTPARVSETITQLLSPSQSVQSSGYTGHIKREVLGSESVVDDNVVDLTSSPEPEPGPEPEPAASLEASEQDLKTDVDSPRNSAEVEVINVKVKQEAALERELEQDRAEPSRKRGRSARLEEALSSEDEDIEVELRKTKLQLREIELERRLKKKRKAA